MLKWRIVKIYCFYFLICRLERFRANWLFMENHINCFLNKVLRIASHIFAVTMSIHSFINHFICLMKLIIHLIIDTSLIFSMLLRNSFRISCGASWWWINSRTMVITIKHYLLIQVIIFWKGIIDFLARHLTLKFHLRICRFNSHLVSDWFWLSVIPHRLSFFMFSHHFVFLKSRLV